MDPNRRQLLIATGLAALAGCTPAPPPEPAPVPAPSDADAEAPVEGKRGKHPGAELKIAKTGKKPKNVVVILVDDLRADAFSFLKHPFSETPEIDRLAREGAWCANAYVTTSLCSPSRATMLSGVYAHAHGVVSNGVDLPKRYPTYGQYLKAAGFETAYVGKWHMGDKMEPRPGWDRWVCFRGQGQYQYPDGTKKTNPEDRGFNVDGTFREENGYVTDLLTDYATKWLGERTADKPFLLVLSHKGVHFPVIPAERHKDLYGKATLPEPLPDTDEAYAGFPRWLRVQRASELGIDGLYGFGDRDEWYRNYFRVLRGIDESLGQVRAALEAKGVLDDTLILFTSDNGFMFGEKGIVDKRCFFEQSVRVPLIARCPSEFPGGTQVDGFALNVDFAPTILDAAGLEVPEAMQGKSLLPLFRKEQVPWRTSFVYEYFFERMFPQTPTVFGLRTGDTKYVTYHGVWEKDEIWDLKGDPGETKNLIEVPGWAEKRKELFAELRRGLDEIGCRLNPQWARAPGTKEDEPDPAHEEG